MDIYVVCSGNFVEDKCKSKGISLATTKKHLSLREKADEHYKRNALRMQLKYSKKKRIMVRIFSPGDYVSVKIPRIDRSSTDCHRLPCVVVKRTGEKEHLYQLR